MLNKTKAQDILNKMFNTSGSNGDSSGGQSSSYVPADYHIESGDDITGYTFSSAQLTGQLEGTVYVRTTSSSTVPSGFTALNNAKVFSSSISSSATYYGATYNSDSTSSSTNSIRSSMYSAVNSILDTKTRKAYSDGASSGEDPNGVQFSKFLYLGLFKTVPDEFGANGVEADYAKYARKKVVGFYYDGANGESVEGAYRALGEHNLPYFPPATIIHREVLDDATTDYVADIMNQEEIAMAVNSDVIDSTDGHTVITTATTCRVKGFGLWTSRTGTNASDLLMWGPLEPELDSNNQPILDGNGDAYVDILRNETPMFYTNTFRTLIK